MNLNINSGICDPSLGGCHFVYMERLPIHTSDVTEAILGLVFKGNVVKVDPNRDTRNPIILNSQMRLPLADDERFTSNIPRPTLKNCSERGP